MMKIESTPTQLLISQVALALFTEPILNLHVESWVRVNLSKISSEHRPLWQLSTANYEMRTNAKHARRRERQQNLKLLSHLSLRRKYILNWINSMFGRSTSTQIVTPTTVAFISARLKLEAKFRLWLCSWRLIGALIWWADERKLQSEPNCMSKKPDFNFNFNDFSSSKAAQGTGSNSVTVAEAARFWACTGPSTRQRNCASRCLWVTLWPCHSTMTGRSLSPGLWKSQACGGHGPGKEQEYPSPSSSPAVARTGSTTNGSKEYLKKERRAYNQHLKVNFSWYHVCIWMTLDNWQCNSNSDQSGKVDSTNISQVRLGWVAGLAWPLSGAPLWRRYIDDPRSRVGKR